MSDVDVIIQVHTQGVQQIANLSSSLRNLHTTLRGISVPMSKLDTQSRAVYKALGITSRGVNDHAKSIRGLVQNQKVLSAESRRLAADLKSLKNTYALVGRESTELGRQVGQTTKELKAFSATFRGMRLRAIGSDFQNISLRLTKIGKDAQFVGRSLLINLTLPLATFARTGLQTFLAIDTQLIRLTKVLEGVAPTLEIAAQKMGAVDKATGQAALNTQELSNRAQKMVSEFNKLETTLTNLSLKFGVSKDLVVSISADFAELGLTAADSITKLAELTLEIEKLGTMDVGPAQDLSQALYFQSRRALDATGAFTGLTSARQKEIATIKAATAQLYLFNAIENVTALTLRDLGDAFPEVASTAISFGLSMTEAAALLAPMKAAGLDVGASANSIKVSLQRLVAPTKQNVDMLQKLAKQFGVAEDKQNSFMLSTKTGLIGLEATVKLFDAVREGGKNNEAALRVMSELFEKRQGPRMYLAIEQLSAFNAELRKADSNFYSLNSTSVSAEVQLVRAAEAVTPGFKNFNSTIVPKTIRSFKDIGNIARIATAKAGVTQIEIEPGKQVTISAEDVANAKAMRQAVSEFVLKKKQAEGIDIISEVDTEAGRALMVQLAGATNAAEVAQNELKRSLDSANTSVQIIKNAFKMFAADIVRDLIPTIQKLAKKVEEMYSVWSSPEFADTRDKIIKFITAFAGFLALLGPTILALGTFNSVVGNVGRGMSVLFPKLKNINGEFVGIGQTAKIAGDSINNLYRRFMDLASARASGPAGAAASARALVADAAGPGRQFISSTTDLGTATARGRSIQKALLSEKGILDIEGGPSAADQEKFFSRYLRTRPTATRIPTSAAMGAAYGVPAEFYDGGVLRPELASRFDDYRTLSVAERRKLSPTAGRRLGKRQLAAVQRFQESQDVFGRKGVGVAQTISDKGAVGPMRYAYRGQDITRDQARNIARGGLGGVRQRVALRAESVRDVAMAPVRSIKRATDGMKEFKNTFTGLGGTSMSTFGKLQVSTTAYFAKLKGGQAALDALILKHRVLGLSAPGAFKQMGATILGVVKNMKLATIATRIFRMALMMTGIGAIIAGVAAVVFLVIKNLDKIKGAKKGWDALRQAFDIFKSALMEIVRPIQDLFAMFGSGSDEGAAAGDAIAKAFDKIGLAVKWLAGMFKMLVEKIIKPYLYGVVNVVTAVVEMFKGNWGGALKYLIAAFSSILTGIVNLWEMLMSALVSILAGAMKIVVKLFFEGIVNGLIQAILLALRGIVNLIGKIPGMKKIMDPVNNAIKKGGSMVSDGMKWISDKIGGGIDFAAGLYKKAIGGMANFAKSALKKGAALGIKESTNEVSKGKKKMKEAGEEAGEAYDEGIASALGGDVIDEATDKVASKLKEGIMDAAQKLQDFVRDRFSSALKKFISDTVNALQKQKEAALKVFDVQINTLMKLEKAEESLTRKKEYETNRRKLIDDATLRREQYRRNRALAIYENRIDDARLMDVEEQVASRESDTEIASLDESRRKDLAKENLDALREAINEAKELAGKFFDESIEKFKLAADKITEIGPVTIEQYTAQLDELKALSTKYADENNVEFGKMFEKFSTTIAEKMPNAVDDFGKALGAFTTPLDELVALAEAKYGLGSEDEATVLGVTHAMSKAVIGLTLGMLVDIGDTFATEAPNVVEKYGLVTGGVAGETGTFKTEVLGIFNTLLEETKTAFLTPYKTAFDEADPTAVFTEAIRLGNLQIQRDFENTLEYNKDLFEKMRGELDKTTLKWLALKAAIDAANDAASGGGAGSGDDDIKIDPSAGLDAETRRFMRMKDAFRAANPQSILLRTASGGGTGLGYRPLTGKEGLTGLERYLAQTRQVRGYKDGGPIPLTGMPLAPYGLSGFLNAPTSQAIPAILHGGEFVVNADAVKRIGLGALAKLNDPRIPKFKKGGLVGASAEERRQMAMKPQAKATLPYTADRMEKLIGPQVKTTLGYTADRMEKLVGKQVPTGPVDRIERQVKEQREAVGTYLRSISTPQAVMPQKDTRSFIEKGLGAAGGFLKAAGVSVGSTATRLGMSGYNVAAAVSSDIVKGKFNVLKNLQDRQNDLYYGRGVTLFGQQLAKPGDPNYLKNLWSDKNLPWWKKALGSMADPAIEDIMNVLPIGAFGVVGKGATKAATAAVKGGLANAMIASGSPTLTAAGAQLIKTSLTGGAKYAANAAIMREFASNNQVAKKVIETATGRSHLQTQFDEAIGKYFIGGQEGFYNRLGEARGITSMEAARDIGVSLENFKQLLGIETYNKKGSAGYNLVEEYARDVIDSVNVVRTQQLRRSSIPGRVIGDVIETGAKAIERLGIVPQGYADNFSEVLGRTSWTETKQRGWGKTILDADNKGVRAAREEVKQKFVRSVYDKYGSASIFGIPRDEFLDMPFQTRQEMWKAGPMTDFYNWMLKFRQNSIERYGVHLSGNPIIDSLVTPRSARGGGFGPAEDSLEGMTYAWINGNLGLVERDLQYWLYRVLDSKMETLYGPGEFVGGQLLPNSFRGGGLEGSGYEHLINTFAYIVERIGKVNVDPNFPTSTSAYANQFRIVKALPENASLDEIMQALATARGQQLPSSVERTGFFNILQNKINRAAQLRGNARVIGGGADPYQHMLEILNLNPRALGMGDTTGRNLPVSMFKQILENPTTVRSAKDIWIKGLFSNYGLGTRSSWGYQLEGQYFDALRGINETPIAFGFNIDNPKQAFPGLPTSTRMVQAQPYEILDRALNRGLYPGELLDFHPYLGKFSPSMVTDEGQAFALKYAEAMAGFSQILRVDRTKHHTLKTPLEELFNPDEMFLIDKFKNYNLAQFDYIAYAALKGNAEAKQMFDQLQTLGARLVQKEKDKFHELTGKGTARDDINLDNLFFVREEDPAFPMFEIRNGRLHIQSRSQQATMQTDEMGREYVSALFRNEIHGSLGHVVGGGLGWMGGRPNIPGANIITARVKDILDYNPGSLETLVPYDTSFVAKPFGTIMLPEGKYKVYSEAWEMLGSMEDALRNSIIRQFSPASKSVYGSRPIIGENIIDYERTITPDFFNYSDRYDYLDGKYKDLTEDEWLALPPFKIPAQRTEFIYGEPPYLGKRLPGDIGREYDLTPYYSINALNEARAKIEEAIIAEAFIRAEIAKFIPGGENVMSLFEMQFYPSLKNAFDRMQNPYAGLNIGGYTQPDYIFPKIMGKGSLQELMGIDDNVKNSAYNFLTPIDRGLERPLIKEYERMLDKNVELQKKLVEAGVYGTNMKYAEKSAVAKMLGYDMDNLTLDQNTHLSQVMEYFTKAGYIVGGDIGSSITRQKVIKDLQEAGAAIFSRQQQQSTNQEFESVQRIAKELNIMNLFHPNMHSMHMEKPGSLGDTSFDFHTGELSPSTLAEKAVNTILRYYSTDNAFIQHLKYYPGTFSRLKTLKKKPWEETVLPPDSINPDDIMDIITKDMMNKLNDMLSREKAAELSRIAKKQSEKALPLPMDKALNKLAFAGILGATLTAGSMFNSNKALAQSADSKERNSQMFNQTLRNLSEFIAGGESLNALDPYSAWAKPGTPGMIMPGMTSMKLGEVIEAAQGHAVGKYQNMPKYLKSRAKVAGFNIGTIFSPEMQEQLMISTLMSLPQENGLGLISYLTGKVGQDTMVNRIANMWRSISGVGGMYVGGGTNPKGFDPSRKDLKVRSYLDILKATYPGYKMGGYVPGSPSTAIPAILHGGEYVINAKAVQQLGMSYLSAMNAATGSRFRTPSSRIGGPNAPVTQSVSNITIQVENFIGEEQWFNTMMDQYNVKVLPKNQKAAGLESRKFTSYNGINQGF